MQILSRQLIHKSVFQRWGLGSGCQLIGVIKSCEFSGHPERVNIDKNNKGPKQSGLCHVMRSEPWAPNRDSREGQL